MENNELTIAPQNTGESGQVFAPAQFEHAQRIAKLLSSSDLVPNQYKGNIANTMVALEMAFRMNASPLMVMQNLHIIHGRPSWASSFIIASINSCGKFGTLRFKSDDKSCRAIATDRSTGEIIEGPLVTMEMAKQDDRGQILYNPHNQYLQTGLEIGVLGMVILLFIVGYGIVKGYKTRNWLLLLLATCLAYNCLFESMLQRQSGIVFFTFWLVILSIYSLKNEHKEISNEHE